MSTPNNAGDTNSEPQPLSTRPILIIIAIAAALTIFLVTQVNDGLHNISQSLSDGEQDFQTRCDTAQGTWHPSGGLWWTSSRCELPDGTNLKR